MTEEGKKKFAEEVRESHKRLINKIEEADAKADADKRKNMPNVVMPKIGTEDLKRLIAELQKAQGIIIPSDAFEPSQVAKADKGKLQITLVPRQIIRDIARVRMFGNAKYKDPDNWKQVSKERYRDAMCRHMLAYLDDPTGVDEESGLTHLAHLATNVAFLCEMEMWDEKKM